jgi:hypothetical protein
MRMSRTAQDQAFIAWLENADMTIGKDLRLRIAARLRELTEEADDGVGSMSQLWKKDLSESQTGARGSDSDSEEEEPHAGL